MRNKDQKASPFRWMLKRYVFLLVTVFVITFAVLPMQGMVRVMNEREYLNILEEPLTPGDQYRIRKELTQDFVYSPLNLEILCALFGTMGFAAAMVLFGHLFTRKQGMMYAALPMTRTKDLWLRTGVYGLYCLVPMVLCIAIHPIMVRANGLWELFGPGQYLQWTMAAVLINMYGFALGVLCAAVFGTFWSAAVGGVLLAGGIELTLILWIRIAHMYLHTMYTIGATREALCFSPVYSLYKSFYEPGRHSLIPGILAIAALFLLAVVFRRAVKPENAGHTLNLKKAEPVLLAWTTVVGGTVGAVVMSLYLGREFMLFLGIILGGCAAWVLTRMLTEQRIHLDFGSWKIPAAAMCVMLIALICLRADVMGFDRYAPKADSLRAVCVQQDQDDEVIRYETPESIQAGLDWAAVAREDMLAEKREQPYRGAYGSVLVTYEKKDGSRTNRQYEWPETRTEMIPALRVLARETGKFRSETLPDTETASVWSNLSSFGLSDPDFQEIYGFSDDIQRGRKPAEICEALRKDLAARTLEDMQRPTLMTVNCDWKETDEDGRIHYLYRSYEIKPSDKHTLKLLLGSDSEKWIEYAEGGFVENEDILTFLCEYRRDENDEWVLDTWRMAESTEEARQWLNGVTFCRDNMFTWPEEEGKAVEIFALQGLRELQLYDEDFQLDLDDPEVRRQLPELCGSNATYRFMIPENSK